MADKKKKHRETALMLAFVYTYARDNPGKNAKLFFIQLPVEYMPLGMLVLTLVMRGWPTTVADSMGIVAAHLYEFLTRIYPAFGGGRNYITTPGFIQRFFAGSDNSGRANYRSYGTAYRPREQQSQGQGWTSSFQNPWSRRGPGRRLGGG